MQAKSSNSPVHHALQARSWLNESVLVPFRGHELALALNVALNLRKLSYDHTLLLALDQASCLRAAGAIPDIGACAAAPRMHTGPAIDGLPASLRSAQPQRAAYTLRLC